jgi:CheY-like chemotaxis protein
MPNSDQITVQLCVIGESDLFLSWLLQRYAEKCGLRVLSASTGDEMLELIQKNKPILVILDPELPGKVRGWEAARLLITGMDTLHIPVIACTWMKKDAALALTGPVSAYLQKPDLHLQDFAEALAAAGLNIIPGYG